MKNLYRFRFLLVFFLAAGFGVSHLFAMELKTSDFTIDLSKEHTRKKFRDGSFPLFIRGKVVSVTVHGGVAYFPATMGVVVNKKIIKEKLLNQLLAVQNTLKDERKPFTIQPAPESETLIDEFLGIADESGFLKEAFDRSPFLNRHMREHPDRYNDKTESFDAANKDSRIRRFVVRNQNDAKRCGLFAVCNAIHFLRVSTEADAMRAFESDVRTMKNHGEGSLFRTVEACCLKVCGDCDFSVQGGEKAVKLLSELCKEQVISEGELNSICLLDEYWIELSKASVFAPRDRLFDELQKISQGWPREDTSDPIWSLLMYAGGVRSLLEDIDLLDGVLKPLREKLLQGVPQVFLINSSGHWIAFRLTFADDSCKNIIVWGADSLGDSTGVGGIKRIIELMGLEIVDWRMAKDLLYDSGKVQ